MTKFAVIDSDSWAILGLTEQVLDDGREYRELPPGIDMFPPEPFSGAVWTWSPVGPLWQDARSDDQRAADARAQRDALLQGSDWRVMRAFEQGQPLSAAWVTYRQSLRDLSSQPGFPNSFTWPSAPTP